MIYIISVTHLVNFIGVLLLVEIFWSDHIIVNKLTKKKLKLRKRGLTFCINS